AVAAFDSVRLMREAETVLSSARMCSFPPALAPRGDRPVREGKRFVLRVCEDDLERARELLAEAEAGESAEGELRCPKCRSWRVYPVSEFWKSLGAMLGLGP